MEEKAFTTVRSLLGALARAMNLINPEMEQHHEQTAYIAYFIATDLGFDEESVHHVMIASLLHDVGSIVNEAPLSVEAIEQDAARYARIGATLLHDLAGFQEIAGIIEYCQSPWYEIQNCIAYQKECDVLGRLASIIHLADVVATCIRSDQPILNQVRGICEMVEAGRDTAFMPEAVDALLARRSLEYFWMDIAKNPYFLMFFTGDIHRISLQQTVEYTKLMSRIIDYRSSFTAMHSAGVAAVAKELAKRCRMSAEDCLKMEIAGNLHDVGKLMVAKEILEKPGKLTDEEFNCIKEHAYYTRLLLMNIEGFSEIAEWAGYHHEKLNGKGYPFHLTAAQLDLGSRIMAVADIFSAITEKRPYRDSMDKAKVIQIMQENVQRGEISSEIVEILIQDYDAIDAIRDRISREAGKRYFASIASEP